MAGKKSSKTLLKESTSLTVRTQQFYGYADYFNRVPLFITLQLSNAGSEAMEDVDVVIENDDGFLLPFSKHLDEVPFESSVEIAASTIVSPLYLTELSDLHTTTVRVRALLGGGRRSVQDGGDIK